MGKVMVITHGELAQSFYETVGMFVAERGGMSFLGLGVDIGEFRNKLRIELLESKEKEFLVLIDLFGGTPFNIVATLIKEVEKKKKKIYVLTGVNLPMLLEIAPLMDELNCQEMKEMALAAGREGIRDLMEELQERGL